VVQQFTPLLWEKGARPHWAALGCAAWEGALNKIKKLCSELSGTCCNGGWWWLRICFTVWPMLWTGQYTELILIIWCIPLEMDSCRSVSSLPDKWLESFNPEWTSVLYKSYHFPKCDVVVFPPHNASKKLLENCQDLTILCVLFDDFIAHIWGLTSHPPLHHTYSTCSGGLLISMNAATVLRLMKYSPVALFRKCSHIESYCIWLLL
jgi:hypothetical protein